MKSTKNLVHRRFDAGSRQTGGLTIFTGIFVLILMTMMLLYATRIAIYEQRVSSNEVRQKQAFHAAESAVDQGLEYMKANVSRLFQSGAAVMADGLGGFRAGLFANDGSTPGWQLCTDAMVASDKHPCGGDMNADEVFGTSGQRPYFYDDPTTASGIDSLPLNRGLLPANTTANVTMLFCVINLSNPGSGCQAPPTSAEEFAAAAGVIQIMGYGWSDCTDVTDISTCTGEASVARPVGNFKALMGAPVIPLTTKTTFPPSGTAEIVTNSNAGGVGVPGSVWANQNVSCGGVIAAVGVGSWATCEPHEWYGRSSAPDGISCDVTLGNGDPACSCTQDEALSWSKGASPYFGIDIIPDTTFPCDLFQFYFGVTRDNYELVKSISDVRSDCSDIGADDSGLIWISGSECRIAADRTIGSPENPVILISAAALTTLEGSAEIFGILYVFDGEVSTAMLNAAGSNTIYGAVVVDAIMGDYTGTFQIVYSQDIATRVSGLGGLGSLSGGWRDFDLPAWQ